MAKKTLTKKSKAITKKIAKKGLGSWVPAPRATSTLNDIKTAVLLVSLALNLAVFVGWLAIKLTNAYDEQVFNFLFNR